MKKILAIAILALAAVPVMAQHRNNHGHHGHQGHHGHHNHRAAGNGNWVAPLILGGVVGYAITRNNEPVLVQPPMVYSTPYCGPWIETLHYDGTIVRQRTCTQ